jgi:hypothetical protein
MVEIVVYPGPCCRIRLGSLAGGTAATVATPHRDGYHRRVVTSGRLAARERGRFRVAGGTAGAGVPGGAGAGVPGGAGVIVSCPLAAVAVRRLVRGVATTHAPLRQVRRQVGVGQLPSPLLTHCVAIITVRS